MREKAHLDGYSPFATRCGLNALPPYQTVTRYVWTTMPLVAKCRNCERLHWQHKSATAEQILAVETALHGIASVWRQT